MSPSASRKCWDPPKMKSKQHTHRVHVHAAHTRTEHANISCSLRRLTSVRRALASTHHGLQYGFAWNGGWRNMRRAAEEITLISLAQMNSHHGTRPVVRLIKSHKSFWLGRACAPAASATRERRPIVTYLPGIPLESLRRLSSSGKLN